MHRRRESTRVSKPSHDLVMELYVQRPTPGRRTWAGGAQLERLAARERASPTARYMVMEMAWDIVGTRPTVMKGSRILAKHQVTGQRKRIRSKVRARAGVSANRGCGG